MSEGGSQNLFAMRDRLAERERAARTKPVNTIITTTGFALVGGGLWEPLLHGKQVDLLQAVVLCTGVVLLALSIYIAPRTEVRHD